MTSHIIERELSFEEEIKGNNNHQVLKHIGKGVKVETKIQSEIRGLLSKLAHRHSTKARISREYKSCEIHRADRFHKNRKETAKFNEKFGSIL